MADGSEQSVHVLLLPYPSQGHINPVLQFGKRLAARRGVRCTLAATRFALSQGQPATGDAVRVAAISDGCDRGGFSEAGGVDAYLPRLESAGSETLDALLRSEAERGRPVRVLVYDAFLPWAPRVARRRGAAAAAFFTQPCAVDVAYAHAFAGRIRPPLADGETVADELPGLPAGLRPADLPSFLAEPSDCPAYLDLLVNQFDGLDTADHVLVNSFHELQPQESDYMASTWRAKTVGPTVPSAYLDNRLPDDTSYGFHLYTPLTATTKAWLDGRPPRSVVYTSFGSVSAPAALQMAEVAEGLYSCGKPFLWVVRASETAKIPEDFAGMAKERGLIVTWSPQLEVLAHPAVGYSIELPRDAGRAHTRLPASSSTSRQNQYFNGLDTADYDVLPAYACRAASRLTRRR
ncbi:UDP-glycosyltransferase 74F2-like [Panicum miliaceum]|uniref:Deoxynivalenol-UDP-glucosyltransferase n=1 Tax=Panicum miliaceum TaxID=4540 RepID=A0A3L6TGE0_PANMI|nr:UDP-glycosyltransferase 74F2-like [Panicum miliaceum]